MTNETELNVDEKIIEDTFEPSKHNVIMLNDNYTPMEWVVELLMEIFKHSRETAEQLTIQVHTQDSAVVGSFSYEIAEQKVHESNSISRSYGFPLTCKVSS